MQFTVPALPADVLEIQLAGWQKASVSVNGSPAQPVSVSEGDVVYCPHGHRTSIDAEVDAYVLHIALAPTILSSVADQLEDTRFAVQIEPMRIARHERLLRLAFSFLRASINGESLETADTESLAEQLAVTLVQTMAGIPSLKSGPERLTARQQNRVLEYMRANLHQQLRLDELAHISGVSKFHFARCFRACLGVSPHQYLIALRLDAARKLLRDGSLDGAAIAAEVGFSDQSALSIAFRQRLGISPGVYRRLVTA
jgi:AraC family transcriptional regulator